jgi:hypothetical protein
MAAERACLIIKLIVTSGATALGSVAITLVLPIFSGITRERMVYVC